MTKPEPFSLEYYKEKAEAFVGGLEDLACRVPKSGNVPISEQEILNEEKWRLRDSFNELVKFTIERFEDLTPSESALLYCALWRFGSSAFQIGSVSIISEAGMAYTRKNQAKSARDAKKANEINVRNEQELISAIKSAVSANGPLAVSIKYANMIRPDVLKSLNIPNDDMEKKKRWPSPSTIRARLRIIKEGKA
jgi:hypothetical protein